MLIQLQEHNKTLLIEGLVSTERVEFGRLMLMFSKYAPNSTIQIMDGEKVLGYDHVLFAVINAMHAYDEKRMICENLALEILVYASVQRQIKNSVEILGIKEDTRQLVLVAISEVDKELDKLKESIILTQGLRVDDSFLNSWNPEKLDSLKRTFKISDAEVESIRIGSSSNREILEKLVIEKMALLAVTV